MDGFCLKVPSFDACGVAYWYRLVRVCLMLRGLETRSLPRYAQKALTVRAIGRYSYGFLVRVIRLCLSMSGLLLPFILLALCAKLHVAARL
jgi:hypothetical protein